MPYADLFGWWIATITWSIAFPIAISIYLYVRRPARRAQAGRMKWASDFAFVWFLLGLLIFYIVSVGERSQLLFAVGNIVVEALLLGYVLSAGPERRDHAARSLAENQTKSGGGSPD